MVAAPKGHNSEVVISKDLKNYLMKVEKLIEDRKSIQEDIREVKKEVKGRGFDMPTFNAMLKLRALDAEERREREELREMYMNCLGLC